MSSETITRNDLKAILNEVLPSNTLINTFYPVGSCYETSDGNFDPNTEWGGTWASETVKDVHIIEEGSGNSSTSSDTTWTWRKWSDGTVEVWGRTASASKSYASNTPVQISRSLPANLFKSGDIPSVTVAGGITGVSNTNIGQTYSNGQSIQTYLINRTGSSVTNTAWATYYFVGLWKTRETPSTIYRWHRTA